MSNSIALVDGTDVNLYHVSTFLAATGIYRPLARIHRLVRQYIHFLQSVGMMEFHLRALSFSSNFIFMLMQWCLQSERSSKTTIVLF